jgi:hypothetical protein
MFVFLRRFFVVFLNEGFHMAMLTSLEDMIRAIAGSIMNAQHMVEKAQVANIASFFNDDLQPSTIDLNLPSMHSQAAPGSSYVYKLPLLSLVPHSSLIISEAEIELDVELGAFQEQDEEPLNSNVKEQSGNAAPTEKKPGLMINPVTGKLAGKNGNAVHIKLKLAASEKSEGLARLINDVVITQGAST